MMHVVLPGKTLLDIMGERASARQAEKARTEAAAASGAEDPAAVQQQEKSAYAWRKWLQQARDKRNGN